MRCCFPLLTFIHALKRFVKPNIFCPVSCSILEALLVFIAGDDQDVVISDVLTL